VLWTPSGVGVARETLALIGVAALVGYGPLAGIRWYRRLRQIAPADEAARLAVYRRMQRRQLIRVAAAVVVMLLLWLSLRNVGMLTGRLPRSDASWRTTPIGLWLLYLAFVLVLQTIVLAKRGMMPGLRRVGPLLPRTHNERRAWLLCSIGAGVSEEIWYRGVLPAAMATVFPRLDIGALLLTQAALFGIAHAYQRWLGVIGTTVMGYLLGVFVVATGSLWLAIAVHVVIDARFIAMPRRVWREIDTTPA
jgi:uncharacterized protein